MTSEEHKRKYLEQWGPNNIDFHRLFSKTLFYVPQNKDTHGGLAHVST